MELKGEWVLLSATSITPNSPPSFVSIFIVNIADVAANAADDDDSGAIAVVMPPDGSFSSSLPCDILLSLSLSKHLSMLRPLSLSLSLGKVK